MSSKHRSPGGGHGNSERWLMTYADLMNNLLALFIVLYMSGVTDLSKFQKVIASFAVTFGNTAVTEAAQNTPDKINASDIDEDSLNAILAASDGNPMPTIIPDENKAPEGAEAEKPEATGAPPGDGEMPSVTQMPKGGAPPGETAAPAAAAAKGNGKGNVSTGKDGSGDAYDELVSRISDLLKAKGYDKNVSVEKGGNYIYLRFREGILFQPDEAVMKDGAAQVLSNISTVIMDSYDLISNIDISGHTARIASNLPSKSNLFSWELSTNRALTVLEYLVKQCNMPQEKLSVSGYSCNQLLVQGDSEEFRAQNRRVEIRLTRAVTGDQNIDVSSGGGEPQQGEAWADDAQAQTDQAWG